MVRAIHAKRFVMIFGILTLFIITGITSTAVAQLSQEEPEPPMSVPEYVMKCYDGKGFAAEPGGVSNLETTLAAAKLLMEYPDSWPVSMGQAVDSIVERYAEMQYLTRGGFVAEGEDGPDFGTTALVVETLDVLNRLDSINVGMVKDYLESSFLGSLTLNKWLTEGDFYTKYWALRTAHTLDCVHLLGLHEVNLHKVIAPDANRATPWELSWNRMCTNSCHPKRWGTTGCSATRVAPSGLNRWGRNQGDCAGTAGNSRSRFPVRTCLAIWSSIWWKCSTADGQGTTAPTSMWRRSANTTTLIQNGCVVSCRQTARTTI